MLKRLVFPMTTALAMAVGTATAAQAQQSTTRGFNLGFHLQGSSLTVEGGDANGGGGAGLRFGYGFNRIFTLYLQLDGSAVDVEGAEALPGDWTMGHVDLGARFHFANALSRWIPFLEAAVGVRAVSVDNTVIEGNDVEDLSFNGASFTAGGGLAFYLKETVALESDVMFTFGEFTEIEVGAISVGNLDIDATSARFSLGVVWWP